MLVSFILYLLIVIIVAVGFDKVKNKTTSDYYTGNRSFGSFITAISAGATDSSGWIFIGAVGTAYMFGSSMMWIIVGATFAYIINWFLIGPKLNAYAIATNSLSLVDVFENKVNDKSHLVKVTAGIIIVLFFVPYMSAQLMSIGTVVEVVFDFDFTAGMIFGSVFVLGYVLYGGYKSVMLTDFIQGLIMITVLTLFPIYFIIKTGGFGTFFRTVMDIDPLLWSAAYSNTGQAAFSLIFGYIIFGLGTIGQPHITQRFISAKSPNSIRNGSTIAVIWIILTILGATLIGLVARVYLPNITNPEHAFPTLASELLPPVLLGITTAALFAAIQSTLSSQLMVATQAIVSDILSNVIKRDFTDKDIVKISRISMVTLLLISILIATLNIQSVFSMVLYAWGGIAASFGPLLILVLYTDKVSKWGAFAGIISGSLFTIIWINLSLSEIIYELVPAAIFATLMILIVSKLFPNKKYSVALKPQTTDNSKI